MAIYEGLTKRLRRENPRIKELWLTFDQIEALCGRELPKSAWFAEFWENPTNRMQYSGVRKSIREAGFRAILAKGEAKVLFTRV